MKFLYFFLSITIPLTSITYAEQVEATKVSEEFILPEAPVDVAGPPLCAEMTENGLSYKVLKESESREYPSSNDYVSVHYTGWTTDGKLFDSTVARNDPASFQVNSTIPGLREALLLMNIGSKFRFWIPSNAASRQNLDEGFPEGMLVFDVELLDIRRAFKFLSDAKVMSNGNSYEITKEGAGRKPFPFDNVTFHYTQSTVSGMKVEDTRGLEKAPTVYLPKVPVRLRESIADMRLGEKRTVWIPEPKALDGYLVEEIELLSTSKAPEIPTAPTEVDAIPATALKTESGLAYKILKPGIGNNHPTDESVVSINYIGWETNGKMIDTSYVRGEPTTFSLTKVNKGLIEGIKLMVVGEKRRFWIPENLAYGPKVENSGVPGGLLVFDVELVDFE